MTTRVSEHRSEVLWDLDLSPASDLVERHEIHSVATYYDPTAGRAVEHLAGRAAASECSRLSAGAFDPCVSISHSGGLAVAVGSPGARVSAVGVDVEFGTVSARAVHLFTTAREREQLRCDGAADLDPTALFSAKEAVYKAFGRLRPMASLRSVELIVSAGQIQGGVDRARPQRRADVAAFPFRGGWLAVCVVERTETDNDRP